MARLRDKKYCGAKKRQGEGNCTRPAGWGTNHVGYGPCKLHGGTSSFMSANAHQQRVEAEARRELARLDVTPVGDPLTMLAELAGQAVAFKNALAERVNRLSAIRFEDAKGSEQLRSEVALWERALDRCERFCTSMARLDIDDRLARVSEQQAAMVADTLAAVLDEMGLSHEQQREARTRVARHLRSATG